jgi:hypothetical protein
LKAAAEILRSGRLAPRWEPNREHSSWICRAATRLSGGHGRGARRPCVHEHRGSRLGRALSLTASAVSMSRIGSPSTPRKLGRSVPVSISCCR